MSVKNKKILSLAISGLLTAASSEAFAAVCVDHTLEDYGTPAYMGALVTPSSPSTSKIKVCHRTASPTNPYVVITISQSAVKDRGHKTLHSICQGNKHADYFWSPTTGCPEAIANDVPIPTVITGLKFQDTATPVITGTIGNTELQTKQIGRTSVTETFDVTVDGVTYSQGTGTGKVVVSGTSWSLALPNAINFYPGSDATSFSKKYEVMATRNLNYAGETFVEMDDKSDDELEIYHLCENGLVPVNSVCPTIVPVRPTVTLGQTATDKAAPTLTGTVGTSTSLTIQVLLNNVLKASGSATLIGTAPNQTWSFTPSSPLAAGTYEIVATGDAASGSLTDAQSNELEVSTATTNTPTVDNVSSNESNDVAKNGADYNWISKPNNPQPTEDTTPTITGTVGNAALGSDTFSVTLTKNGVTVSTGATPTLGTGDENKKWSLAVTTPLAAGVYEVNAVRTAGSTVTTDSTPGELIVGIPYCNNGVSGYLLRPSFNRTTDYLGTCDSAVTKTAPLSTYKDLEELKPQKLSTNSICTDAEGGGTRNTQDISTATIKRATIINATTLGGTTTKNLADTVVKYGERSGGTMDISKAEINGGVAKNVTLTDVTIENLYLDIEGSFDISTGVFTPSDTYIGVKDGTTGVTKPSGDGGEIPKSQITDGVITSGTASGTPIRGRILAGFYDTKTSSTTTTTTKGRRTFGTLTGATITGATTTTAKMTNGSIKTVIEGGDITGGVFAITSTFGTATNAKIEKAVVTNVNSCFSSSEVGSRGQLNWKEVVSE